MPTLSPAVSCLIDFFCMAGFLAIACLERKWRHQTKGEKRRTALLCVYIGVATIDMVRCFFAMKYPYFANLMRVGVLLTFAMELRQKVFSLISDLKDSFDILMTIFTYILVFTLTVYYFYRSTFEGFQNFGTIKDAYRNMTILFTTANFPDVFLPAMSINYFNAFLFMFFMLIGLYFLTNLLLANVFNKYEQRLKDKRQKRINKRMDYIGIIYERHDTDHSSCLNNMEAKSFLADVFDLDYQRNEVHRHTAKKILEIIDVDDSDRYTKEHVQQFFKLPNFIEISGIEHINSFQALARLQSERAETYGQDWPVESRSRAGFFDGWVQVILILLNLTITIFFILNDQFKDEKKVRSGFWRMVSIPFTAVFFVECCMVIFTTSGTKIIQEKKLYILEFLCQIVSILAYAKMFTPNGPDDAYATGASMLSFAFLLRNLRISYLLQEVKEFKVIMEMIMKMTVPILYMLCALYLCFYVFAIIGMYGLGGEIRQPLFHSESGIPNNLYYMVNFNDLG